MDKLSATTSIKVAPSVNSSDYFLGVAQEAIASRENVQIEKIGKDGHLVWVAILSEQKTYRTNVTDGRGFYGASAAEFTIQKLGKNLPEQFPTFAERPLENLLWRAAYYVAEGRLIQECSVFDVIRLRHWPNLTRLPATPNTFRVFALLSRYPTSIGLLHRVLGISKSEVFQVISAAYCAGLIEKVNCNVDFINKMNAEAERPLDAGGAQGFFNLMVSKITGL